MDVFWLVNACNVFGSLTTVRLKHNALAMWFRWRDDGTA